MTAILSNTVARLHLTFRGSAFQISKRVLLIFIAVITLLCMTLCVMVISLMFPLDTHIAYWILFIGFTIYFPLYIISAVIAVRLFARNLIRLAQTQALYLSGSGKQDRLVVATA